RGRDTLPRPVFEAGGWSARSGRCSGAYSKRIGAMPDVSSACVVDLIRQVAHPLTGGAADYDPLLEQIRDARLVLLGEASHGTDEFYRERAEITKRLVRERNFSVVGVEADWP